MPAPRRSIDPELASWARSAFRPASVTVSPEARATAEKRAIARVIETSPHLGVAAKRLSVSRKTLFNRMREYGMAPGKSGRPREYAPHAGGAGQTAIVVAFAAVAVVSGFFLGRWWMRRRAAKAALPAVQPALVVSGIDVFCSR